MPSPGLAPWAPDCRRPRGLDSHPRMASWSCGPWLVGRAPLTTPQDLNEDSAKTASRSNIDFAKQLCGGLVELIGAAELLEFFEQLVRPESLLRGARGVEDHPALVDHHQPIAERGGVGHRVGHHHGCELVAAHDLLG